MIYDTFTFYNSLDILEIRLRILDPVVDRFVLVEGTRTFNNSPKELIFQRHRHEERFAAFLPKIELVTVDQWPEFTDPWLYEVFQRNSILRGLGGCRPGDVVIVSDTDEIPDPEAVKAYRPEMGLMGFEQLMISFYLNNVDIYGQIWYGSKIAGFEDFTHGLDHLPPEKLNDRYEFEGRKTTPNRIRLAGFRRNIGRNFKKGGWHFHSIMPPELIADKIKEGPHQEFNLPHLTSVESIKNRIADGQGIYGGGLHCPWPLDGRFPEYLRNNQAKYAHLILPVSADLTRRRYARLALAKIIGPPLGLFYRWGRSIRKRLPGGKKSWFIR
jgi:beta-1,4-mannosyl-glycoprotein beta-1,4-N-acetylglucosaminyltransferase